MYSVSLSSPVCLHFGSLKKFRDAKLSQLLPQLQEIKFKVYGEECNGADLLVALLERCGNNQGLLVEDMYAFFKLDEQTDYLKALGKLHQLGLVERRSNILSLTPSGKDLAENLPPS